GVNSTSPTIEARSNEMMPRFAKGGMVGLHRPHRPPDSNDPVNHNRPATGVSETFGPSPPPTAPPVAAPACAERPSPTATGVPPRTQPTPPPPLTTAAESTRSYPHPVNQTTAALRGGCRSSPSWTRTSNLAVNSRSLYH